MLQGAGYATAAVGKRDMGQAKRFLPLQRGFGFFYGHGNNGIDYYTHERYGGPSMFLNNDCTEADRAPMPPTFSRASSCAFSARTSQNHGSSTSPSTLHTVRPPLPLLLGRKWSPRPRRHQKTSSRPIEKRGIGEKFARYYGAVTCMNAAIGEILKTIRESGGEKDTLLIFMSDNGGAGNEDNAPLTGSKSTMWEGGLRVPFIARWPGHIPAGTVIDDFITSLEVFPTLLVATGTKPPPNVILDGFDMMPILAGREKSPRTEMFWQRRNEKAARVGNWKCLESAKGTGLFDLSGDVGETKVLSAEKPDVLAKIKGR